MTGERPISFVSHTNRTTPMAKKSAIASPVSSDFQRGAQHALDRMSALIGQGTSLSEAQVIIAAEVSTTEGATQVIEDAATTQA